MQLLRYPRADPRGIFEGAKSPLPGQRKAAKPRPLGQKFTCENPGQNKTEEIEEINQRYMLKRHINLLKTGISMKQNHLLKLKYSLHMSETIFRIVVLISINTCITVVLQIYSLKLLYSYLKTAENVLSSSNYRAQAEWYW